MSTKDQVVDLTNGLDAALAQAGLPTGKIALRGSAVTEHKFNKATNRYSGQRTTAPNDYDVAIVSSELLAIAKKKGVKLLPNGKRSPALGNEDLEALGIKRTLLALQAELGLPKLTVMIYRDDESLIRRGAMMWLKELGG